MNTFGQDLRYGVRKLRNSPGFAAVAVITLALGIGAATAIFSVVNGLLVRPLPYPEPDRLVQLWHLNDDGSQSNFSYPNFLDLRDGTQSFEAMAAYRRGMMTLTRGADGTRVPVTGVSTNFFEVVGSRPELGRTLNPNEIRNSAPVVVVAHGYWQNELGGEPGVVGSELVLDGLSHTIVGVMPPEIEFPAGTEIWAPDQLRSEPSRTNHSWRAIGRLADGVSLLAARQELSTIARRLKGRYGDDTWMSDAGAVPLHEEIVGDVRPMLYILLGAAGLLLLIACTNVTNLLLARATARRQEMTVRLALGAGRRRLTRQILTESLLLALLAGALGLILSIWGVEALLALEPGRLPRLDEVGVDWMVFGFAFGVACVCALGMGLITATRMSGDIAKGALSSSQRTQAGGTAGQRLRGGLVAGQIALTLVLLIGAGLLGRSFLELARLDPGYRTEGAVVMELPIPAATGESDNPMMLSPPNFRGAQLLDGILTRMRSVPGVESVGGVDNFPLGAGGGSNGMYLKLHRPDDVTSLEDWERLGRDANRTGFARYRIATDGYFRTMNIRLISGRLFDDRDDANGTHVAVVSQSFALDAWPNEDAVGKWIQFGNMDGDIRPFRIVGVVGDVREGSLESEPFPTLYGFSRQRTVGLGGSFSIVMRGPAETEVMVSAAREIMRDLGPGIPLQFRTLEEIFSASLDSRRFSLMLLGVFGMTALLLAMMGIYGVVSYSVTQRTQEIGVRMALGAGEGRVLGLLLRQGMLLMAAGLALGLVAAFAITRVLSSMLYGITTTDPTTFIGVAAILTTVPLLASYLPARRATRVDPVTALRAE